MNESSESADPAKELHDSNNMDLNNQENQLKDSHQSLLYTTSLRSGRSRSREKTKDLQKQQKQNIKKQLTEAETMLPFDTELASQMSMYDLLEQMNKHYQKKEAGGTETAQNYKDILAERLAKMDEERENLRKGEEREEEEEQDLLMETVDQIEEQLEQLQPQASKDTKSKRIITQVKQSLKKMQTKAAKKDQEIKDLKKEVRELKIRIKQIEETEKIKEEKRQIRESQLQREAHAKLMEREDLHKKIMLEREDLHKSDMMERESQLIKDMNTIIRQNQQQLLEEIKLIRAENCKQLQHIEENGTAIDGPSYADVTNYPPLPLEKPTLIITPKDKETSIPTIKKVLNSMNMSELPQMDCQTTKQNRIIITCKNKMDLEQVRRKINTTEDMPEKINIKEPNPKMARIIIFGVPEAPLLPKSNASDVAQSNEEENFELYDKQLLQPALLKALKRQIQYKVVRILRGRPGTETSHLVLQLNERDALILMAAKVCIGFNRCTVRRYVSIQRCFHCQLIGHTAKDCKNPEACAKCGQQHNAQDCRSSRYNCVNCRQLVDYYNGDYRRAGVHTQHPSYDPQCSVYQRRKQDALKSMSSKGKHSI